MNLVPSSILLKLLFRFVLVDSKKQRDTSKPDAPLRVAITMPAGSLDSTARSNADCVAGHGGGAAFSAAAPSQVALCKRL